MKVLVIGDVHGCYHTLRSLVEKHWDPETMTLIQLGDLINKGKHSGLCLKYWLELEEKHPGKTVLLRGNHEQVLIDAVMCGKKENGAENLVNNITESGLKPKKVVKWLLQKDLKWESATVLITHAGISKYTETPFDLDDPRGVLYNRTALKNLGKMQVVGHTMVKGGKPVFDPKSDAWFLDTGAWTKKYLSALLIAEGSSPVKVIREMRDPRD